MTHQDPYELWKAARSNPQVAATFADKVMEGVRRLQADAPSASTECRLLRHPVGLAAGLLLGGASLALARLACVILPSWGIVQKGF